MSDSPKSISDRDENTQPSLVIRTESFAEKMTSRRCVTNIPAHSRVFFSAAGDGARAYTPTVGRLAAAMAMIWVRRRPTLVERSNELNSLISLLPGAAGRSICSE